MKTAVVYYSKHHGNTKKLLDAIKSAFSDEITLFDATKTPPENLEEYDLIGFASGIYYSKFQKNVLEFARNHTPSGKKVFLSTPAGLRRTDIQRQSAKRWQVPTPTFSANLAVWASTPSDCLSWLAELQRITPPPQRSTAQSLSMIISANK